MPQCVGGFSYSCIWVFPLETFWFHGTDEGSMAAVSPSEFLALLAPVQWNFVLADNKNVERERGGGRVRVCVRARARACACEDNFVAMWNLYLTIGFTCKWSKMPCEILCGDRVWYVMTATVVWNIYWGFTYVGIWHCVLLRVIHDISK
jgi:hypothetical protein